MSENTTLDNLMDAFAGEAQANRKYLAYAKKAEKDGKINVAKPFRAASDAETLHALKHFEVAGKIGSTADNLKDGIAGETHEYKDMYPDFVNEAEAAGNSCKRLATSTRFPQDIEDQPHFATSQRAALRVAVTLFALHPLAVYAVGYLIQRSILMATLFALLACWAFVRGLQTRSPAWFTGALLSYLLAVLSKEHAVMTVGLPFPCTSTFLALAGEKLEYWRHALWQFCALP